MAKWKVSVLGLSVLVGLMSCQISTQKRAGIVFSLGKIPNKLGIVEGNPAILEGGFIKYNKVLKFNNSNTLALSLAVDTQNESLYYFDVHLKSIYRINNFNLDVEASKVTYDVIREGISGSAVQIAFDWISKNIYWNDDYNNWIALHPVFTKDKTMQRNIIETMLTTPLALAIDPKAGFLFFSDLRPSPRIEVCNLFGEERGVLVTSGLSYPSHIAVDHNAERIFWADSRSGAVESILYNGLNRTLLFAGVSYYASSLLYFKRLSLYVLTDKCKEKKCQHFCISMPTMARCVCKEGYLLNKDGVNCTAGHILTKKGILFTNGSNICVLDIRAINNNNSRSQCVVNKLTYIHYLQADSNKGIIYHWNKHVRSIQKYNLVTGRIYNVTFTNDVKGLFLDWVNEGLYWSDSDQYGNRIRMFDLITQVESLKHYQEDVKSFEYLTGNPYDNVLFWVLKENAYSSTIEMGTMKGSNRTTVMESNYLTKPTALAYDAVNNRLFWIDDGQISSVKITANMEHTKITYHDYTGSSANTLYLYKDYALWIHNNNIKAVVVEKNDEDVYKSTVVTVMTGSQVTSMTYFDQRTQTKTRAPCEGDNGGCQYICIPTPDGPICKCPFGYKKNKNGKTCENTLLTEDFALISDYNGRMYQIPINKNVTEVDIVAVNVTEDENGIIHELAYDATNNIVYWLVDGNELYKSKLNGENFTSITKKDDGYIGCYAVDESTGNVYILVYTFIGYSSGYTAVLRQMASKEWKQKTIMKELKDYMLIHPQKGYIFWLDHFQKHFERTFMDGTGRVMLKQFTANIWQFFIDYSDDRLYWADDINGNIYSIDISGNYMKKFRTVSNGINFIAFQDNSIFISIYGGSKIYRYDKMSTKEIEWMKNITYIEGIVSMVLVPGNKQPKNTACKNNNGNCSTFCLATSFGRTCACEDNVQLRSDQKTCENVCDNYLPNGHITDCAINPGAVCSYKCNSLFDRNKSIDKIMCLQNMTWDQKLDNLCKEKRCTMNIPNVELLGQCDGKIGSVCSFRCQNSYVQRNYNLPTISCFGQSGFATWNTDINKLCTKAVTCPVQIPHGRLLNCQNPTAGDSCTVFCRMGYNPLNPSRLITCGSDGNWNERLDQICKDQGRCPNGTGNVQISASCPRTSFNNCSFICLNGKVPAFPHVERVTCVLGNQWIPPLNILCKDPGGTIAVTDPSRQQQRSTNTSGVIGGVLGTIIVILVICLVMGIICYKRRTRTRSEYKEEPNIFFRNPSVSENPYNRFSNVDEGQITGTQFSNPMSNIDSIYDNISDRQAAEGTSPSQQSMKIVEGKTMDTSYNEDDIDNKVNTGLKKEASIA